MPPISAARSSPASRNTAAASPLLRLGARGPAVARLQQQLINAGFAPGVADGAFGPRTLAALRAFQSSKGLQSDGVHGPLTAAALASAPAATATAPVSRPGAVDTFSPAGTRVTGYVRGQPSTFSVSDIGNGKSLRTDAAAAFRTMQQAARRDGVSLHVVSGFRTMSQQQNLYTAYRAGRGNLAARPGYSTHQSGVSVDVHTGGSYQSASYRWLSANGRAHGFVNDVRGEPWHWTYRG